MTGLRRVFLLALPLAMVWLVEVSAQPVNAPPGTVCVTPQGWCWAVRPGPPGAPCACQTIQGWLTGLLR